MSDSKIAEALSKAVAELQGAGLKAPCYCVSSKHWPDCSFSVRAKVLEECREALAAHEAEQAEEAAAWLVIDSTGQPMHAAGWEAAAHEHINDAISEYDLREAAEWRVVPVYTRQQQAVTDEQALANERDRICAEIKAEDDYCVTEGDYMLDSDDCIKIVRGEWARPDYSVTKEPANAR